MIRIVAILGLLAVVSLAPLADSPAWGQTSRLGSTPLPSARLLGRYGLELGWWGQATVQGQRDKIVHVAIDERSVVTLSASGILTLFDAETGQKMWMNRIGRDSQASFLPVMNDRLIMLTSGLRLYALDRLNGRIMWQLNIPRVPSSGPSADENNVYVGSTDGSVYAYELRTILRLYQERLLPEYTQNALLWRYQAGGAITSPPISTGRSVLFASRDHSLYAVGAKSRRLLFQFETDGPIGAPLVMHRGNIFVASEDYNFYCLNANNGQVRWSFLSPVGIRKSPHVISGTSGGERQDIVYLFPELGGVRAILASNGREAWSQGAQNRAVDFQAASEQYLFVTDQLHNTLLLDRADGSVVGVLPTSDYSVKIHNDRTDRLFLVRPDGLMVMIREHDHIFPTYHKYPNRKPILPELFDPKTMKPAQAADDDAADNANDDDAADADDN